MLCAFSLLLFAAIGTTVRSEEPAAPLALDSHPASAGSAAGYRFSETQHGSSAPVTYDGCRAVSVVVNPAGGPPDADALVKSALARVSEVSGLELRYDGHSRLRPHWGYHRYQSWPPVLITFASPHEVPALRGDVEGIGGSVASAVHGGAWRQYTQGDVTLDSGAFAWLQTQPHGRAEQRAIVMHELGHVLGLGHVKDRHELMYARDVGQTDFGPGDRRGLRILGHGRCFS